MQDGVTIVSPELNCSYLFSYLLDCGVMSNNGTGNIPLSWQELLAWMQAVGVTLNAWEVKVIHRASEVYVNQLELSRKPDAPMPERIVEHDQGELAKRIKSILR